VTTSLVHDPIHHKSIRASERVLQSLNGLPPFDASAAQDRQNSEEEGVFLSQAALEQMRKDKEAKENGNNSPGAGARKVLSLSLETEKSPNFNNSYYNYNKRSLLQHPQFDSNSNSQSYAIQVSPVEISTLLLYVESNPVVVDDISRIQIEKARREKRELQRQKQEKVDIQETVEEKEKPKEAKVSGGEVRMFLFWTVLGISLILAVYLKLLPRKRGNLLRFYSSSVKEL